MVLELPRILVNRAKGEAVTFVTSRANTR